MNLLAEYLLNSPAGGLPQVLIYLISMLTACAAVVVLMLLLVMFFTWWERKVAAHIQDRLGPMRVGGWHGWAQPIADTVKLLVKEDIIPDAAIKRFFNVAPVICFIAVMMGYAVLVFGPGLTAADLNIGLFYLLAISSLTVIGILMGAWASGNKWSLIGGMRSAAQIVSYELPVALSMIPAVLLAGSLNMGEIITAQSGGIHHWFIFNNPFAFLAFFVYFVASLAENNRAPFDLPEAESELVAGFFTEYTGLRFAFFFLAEYAEMFLLGAVAVTLFLGGWEGPLGGTLLPGWLMFIFKTLVLVTIVMWFRWTYPRLRVDQLMRVTWKYLLPLAFLNIAGVAVWMIVTR